MRIAVTGGIGSGKSVVMDMFNRLGYNCVSSDKINEKLLADKEYISKIAKAFPSAVENGVVNKKTLSNIVFTDKNKLEILNSIAHPSIRKLSHEISNKEGINFVEVPLLFECGFESDYDKVILVTADLQIRIARASKRDNKSKEDIIKIINNQIKSYEGKKIDYVIINNADLNDLEVQVQKVLQDIQK